LIRAVIRLIVVDHTTLISVLFVTWWLVCMWLCSFL
jgi:phosphate starvation-inducible membrane PsiE